MSFYIFRQINSHGYFVVDDYVCARVVIEADSREEAIEKAESIGLYWDGVKKNIDCPCCGDRWNQSDADVPYSGSLEIDVYMQFLADTMSWTTPSCRIFFKRYDEVMEIYSEEDKIERSFKDE